MKRVLGSIVISAVTSAAITAVACFLYFQKNTAESNAYRADLEQRLLQVSRLTQQRYPSDPTYVTASSETSTGPAIAGVTPSVDSQRTASLQSVSSGPSLQSVPSHQATKQLAAATMWHRLVSRQWGDRIVLSDEELAEVYAGAQGANPASGSGESAEDGQSDAASQTQEKTSRLQESSQEREPEQSALDVAMLERGGLLLPKGKWQVEPSFAYTFIASNTLDVVGISVAGAPELILLALTQTEKIRRDILLGSLTIRHGLLHNFQVEARVPYRYQREERTFSGNGGEDTLDGHGLGDVEFGISRQLLYEGAAMPGVLANFGVKSKTGRFKTGNEVSLGSGSYAFRGGLLFVKTDDPLVFFARAGYMYSTEEDHGGSIGKLKPGDTLEFAAGFSMAMSYRSAVSFSATESVSFDSQQNGTDIANSSLNVATLRVGVTHAMSEKTSMDVGVQAGLTDDAPDFGVDIRFPRTF